MKVPHREALGESRFIKGSAPVFEQWIRLLNAGDVARKIVFSQDRWLGSLIFAPPNQHASHFDLSFARYTPGSTRLTLKEFAHGRLNSPGRGKQHRAPAMPPTVRGETAEVARLIAFAQEDGRWLTDLDQPDLDRYLARERVRRELSPKVAQALVVAIQNLYHLSPRLTHGGLVVAPWENRPATRVVGVAPASENKTPRIPEAVMGPYLQAALFYVRVAAKDILAAHEELRQLRMPRPARSGETEQDRLRSFIDRRRAEGRGLPMLDAHQAVMHSLPRPEDGGVVNLHLTALLSGTNCSHIQCRPKLRRLIDDAVRELGLEAGGMDTPVSANPQTGRPWRDRFSPREIKREARRLTTACYIVTAYLSGMRDSEAQGLARGCHRRRRSADGVVVRRLVDGEVWKDTQATGRKATWVVIQPVAEAVEVLENLHDSRRLFMRVSGPKRSVGTIRTSLRLHLNQFRARAIELGYVVPDHNGLPWKFNSMQFRRTLAWHIARQPFGAVAGMIQYQHASVAMFEGYAGTSASGFRAEVEAEEEMARLDDLLTRYEDYKRGLRQIGPGAKTIDSEFARIREKLGDFPGMVVDRHRLRALLKNLSETLNVAPLNDCYFDPDKALCLKKAKEPGRKAPFISMCEPGKCANSCIGRAHKPAWKLQEREIVVALRERPPPLQCAVLQARLTKVRIIVESLDNDHEKS